MVASVVIDEVRPDSEPDEPAPEDVAGGLLSNPVTTAAIVGGVLAAGAGAYLGTRTLARRNSKEGKPVNSVMANAITAHDVNAQSEKDR
jgi:hypothetical protein